MKLIAELDRTSSYFLISCLEARTCYILQINNSTNLFNLNGSERGNANDNINFPLIGNKSTKEGCVNEVYFKNITEFTLSSGILSFSVVDAAVQRYKNVNFSYLYDEIDDNEDESSSMFCIILHTYIVQSKSVQECWILYQPELSENHGYKITSSGNDPSSSAIEISINEKSINFNDIKTTKTIKIENFAESNEVRTIKYSVKKFYNFDY